MANVTEREKEIAGAILKKNGLPTRFTDRDTATRNRMLQDDIAAAVAGARAAWQPIETAPVGISVLIYIPYADHYGEGIYRALLIESDWMTDKDGKHPRHWQTTGLHHGRDCLSQLPTHWMPLPDPPEVKD